PCLIIGNTGSGKSEALNFLKNNFKDVLTINTVSMASLKQISYELNNYNGIIFVDDVGAINTQYMRITTVSTLVYLAYQHYLRRLDTNSNFEIKDFNGSLIINIQPAVFDEIVSDASFEANVMDKTYRYYNMRIADNKPFQHPKLKGLENIKDNFDKTQVKIDKQKVEALADAFLNFNSPARRYKMVYNFVKLTAILNNHKSATGEDYNFVSKLLLNNIIESELLQRQGVSNKFKFNTFLFNIMLMTKYYGNIFHVSKLAKYLNLSQKTIYRHAKTNNIKIDNGFIVYNDNRILRVLKHEL
ncbi:MAG: hypothetical protein C0172_00385, partial [Caldisphaera sp.]